MSWRFVEDSQPIARQYHACLLCERTIVPGVAHVKRMGYQDGRPHSFRMHTDCELRTRDWTDSDWSGHEPAEFRSEVLGLEG